MGAKICTPSPEKLDNEQKIRHLDSLEEKVELPEDFNNVNEDSYDDDYADEEQYDNIDLNLPDYEKQLIFQRLPFFENLGNVDYRSVMGKYLVRVLGWEALATNKVVPTKRILAEIKILQKTLPCELSNSIFVAVNEKDMSQMQCIIFGSEGTPYQHGAFLYTVNLLETYPNDPPKVNLQTTGGHRVRFNPNLYESGYVCLSLLGTWTGEPKQNWQPGHSNISQILLSIQTIVMNQHVYYNEPSYEDSDRTACKGYNIAYQNIVKFGNIAYAMNDMLQNPPQIFKKLIKTHFYLKRNKILQSVYQWIEDTNIAQYGDLVQEHNYLFCNRYSRPWLYKNDLIIELQKLHNNLSSINITETYLHEEEKAEGEEVEQKTEQQTEQQTEEKQQEREEKQQKQEQQNALQNQ